MSFAPEVMRLLDVLAEAPATVQDLARRFPAMPVRQIRRTVAALHATGHVVRSGRRRGGPTGASRILWARPGVTPTALPVPPATVIAAVQAIAAHESATVRDIWEWCAERALCGCTTLETFRIGRERVRHWVHAAHDAGLISEAGINTPPIGRPSMQWAVTEAGRQLLATTAQR